MTPLRFPLLVVFMAAASGVAAADAPDRKAADEIKKLAEKAKKSDDPVRVWMEAAKSDQPEVRTEAVFEMNRYADVRSLPVLDDLATHNVARPPVRLEDAPPHYPTVAAGVAKRIRAKQALEQLLARTPAEKRVQATIDEYEKGDPDTQSWIHEYWLSQPPSDDLIAAMLRWPRIGDDRLRDYLARVDKQFDPTLRKILLESRSDDAITILADVLGRRKNKKDIPFIVDALGADRGGKARYAVVGLAHTLAKFGDESIPLLEDRWGAQANDEPKTLYAMVCRDICSASSEETLSGWVERTRAGFKVELLKTLNAELDALRAARRGDGKKAVPPKAP